MKCYKLEKHQYNRIVEEIIHFTNKTWTKFQGMSELVLIINKADFQSLIKNVLITNQAQGLYMYLSLLVTATIEILPCT